GAGRKKTRVCAATPAPISIRGKRKGGVQSRDLIPPLTEDKEIGGDADGIQWLLQNRRELIEADYSLNLDIGDFQSKEGNPYIVPLAAAEKKSTAIQLQTINRGGHGSLPRKDNAIYELTAALERLLDFQFPAMLNDVTRAQFAAMSKLESGQVANDMKAVAQNPHDAAAIQRLSDNPYYNALLRTTCVPTLL